MKRANFIKDRCTDVKIILWTISFLWLMLLLWSNQKLYVCADTVTASDMAEFEGVTVSSDGEAWVTEYKNKNVVQMQEGYEILTGVDSTLPVLQTGEHFYKDYVEGSISVYKWSVRWARAQCIHSFPEQNYHGFETNAGICESYYHSGWYAYCAVCEEPVAEMNIYASKETVRDIASMPAQSTYAYICPYCNGLEQGVSYQHFCKKVSYNHYKVAYEANAPEGAETSGYMAITKHMYNNAKLYEGQSAVSKGYADTKLRKNSFSCVGYVFAGWNENADGTGNAFSDEETVWNLSATEGEVVTLYAQWVPASSVLTIDANGGTYLGQGTYAVTQNSGTSYVLCEDEVGAPSGWQVLFETNGGSEVPTFKTKRVFSFWEPLGDLYGTFVDNIYTFGLEADVTDVLVAKYTDEAIILPESQKENELLVGWYKDETLSAESFLGKPGEEACISESCTLYAKWSALSLWSEENYEVYDGIGAVDLEWHQKDSEKLYYKLYQSQDKETWLNIWDISSPGDEFICDEKLFVGSSSQQIEITKTGYYRLQAFGEQSKESTESKGLGGSAKAEYWLESGDVLQVYASASESEQKNGADTEVHLIREETKTPLLIARGGSMDESSGGVSRTTLAEPAIEDIAFKSKITEMFPNGTVVYVLFNNYTSYPTLKISGEAWAEAIGTVEVGGLNRALQTLRTNYVYTSSGESDWGEEIVATASEGVAPYWGLVQSAGGFSRTFVATYPTNGNTNLVVSAAIYNWSQNTDGDIRFRILDAATGTVLYDETPVFGFSGLDGYVRVTEVLTWADYDVSNVEEVTVEVYMKQVADGGAHTKVSLCDTFFYGKTIGESSDSSGKSNYINSEFGCRNASDLMGVHANTGYVTLESIDVGYQDSFSLKEVLAKDMLAPEKIAKVAFSEVGDERIEISISPPKDKGSVYYHKAESYRLKDVSLSAVSVSNVTQNILLTGIVGYHYYVDEYADGDVSQTHSFSESMQWNIECSNQDMYIHIAAIDQAGNLGETASFPITTITQEDTEKTPQIHTNKPYIVDTEYVYSPKTDFYYVKADGKTEHTICSSAYLTDMASSETQIERLRTYANTVEGVQWFEVEVPHGDIAKQQETFWNDMLVMTLDNHSINGIKIGAASALRKEHGRVLEVSQTFCAEESQEHFEVYPQAFLEVNGKTYASDNEEGIQQSITIMPDAIQPHITGIEELLLLDVYDWEMEIEDILLWAYDQESGIEEFFVTITNNDNHLEKTYYGDAVDELCIPIDSTDPLFRGSLSFLIVAVDRVGNANIIGENGLTFTLDTYISKERAPDETVFKKGEGAVLEIATTGYVERIEVTFPTSWQVVFPEINEVYIYEQPCLRTCETLQFSIPLEIAAQSYEILVSAYKNGECLVSKPTVIVVEGSVLDELRTRIRNNG